MSESPLLSIIIPVYNVKEYLNKSIESVLDQDYDNFEVIIIDDGSTDGSSEICDSFAGNFNVTVVHIPNSGVANARNTGLKIAKGKYVAFFDSDDYAEKDMYSKMVCEAEKNNSEIVITGFHMMYYENNRKLDYPVFNKSAVYNKDEFKKVFYELLKKNLLSTPWNKLYLKSRILENNIEFPNKKCEDIYFNLELFSDINKISILEDTPYHWFRSRPGSETARIYVPDILWQTKKEVYEGIVSLCDKWNVCNEEYMSKVNCYYTDRLIQCIQEIMAFSGYSYKEKRKYIKEILHDKTTIRVLKIAKPDSSMMKICYVPLKLRNITLAALMGWFITFVKTRFANVFYNLRSKEIHNADVLRKITCDAKRRYNG